MPDSPVSIAYRSAMEVIAAAEPRCGRGIVGELESQRASIEAHRFQRTTPHQPCCSPWAIGCRTVRLKATPGHRFYAGCEMVDRIGGRWLPTTPRRSLAPSSAHVQPHSGSTQTWSAYWAILCHSSRAALLFSLAGVDHVKMTSTS